MKGLLSEGNRVGSGFPAAIHSMCSTRSSPDTNSVIGCSTSENRVFLSLHHCMISNNITAKKRIIKLKKFCRTHSNNINNRNLKIYEKLEVRNRNNNNNNSNNNKNDNDYYNK